MLLVVRRPPSGFLLLVAMPFAPSSVLAPSSEGWILVASQGAELRHGRQLAAAAQRPRLAPGLPMSFTLVDGFAWINLIHMPRTINNSSGLLGH